MWLLMLRLLQKSVLGDSTKGRESRTSDTQMVMSLNCVSFALCPRGRGGAPRTGDQASLATVELQHSFTTILSFGKRR